MVNLLGKTFCNNEYPDKSRLLTAGTSSEDSGIFFKKQMPSNIVSHEGASFLRKEPLNSWSMQSIAGSTSSIGKWNKLIILICWYGSNEGSGILFFLKDGPPGY